MSLYGIYFMFLKMTQVDAPVNVRAAKLSIKGPVIFSHAIQ